VQLVSAESLSDRRAALKDTGDAVIYSLAPVRQPADALALHVDTLEQARGLMARVVLGEDNSEVHLLTRVSRLATHECCLCQYTAGNTSGRVARVMGCATLPEV
jgi:hypothetical protein